MPLYEYQCSKCGEIFELIERFSDPPMTTHAGCGGEVHRLLSAPALQFKGSGWYVTDYARGSKPGGKNGGSTKSDSDSSKSTETKSEPAKTESSTTKSSDSSSSSTKPTK